MFDGGSFVIATDGTVLARAPQFVEHLLVWDLLGDDDAPATGADRTRRSHPTRRSTAPWSPACAAT